MPNDRKSWSDRARELVDRLNEWLDALLPMPVPIPVPVPAGPRRG